ncbi:MAG: universal stress protein [Acidobacteria bacterium]|nr:universal stress protein [Acidobacteriota bacterium]
MLMRDILVAVDGSPDSDAAVDAAAYLCRKGEGTIYLLHVLPLGRAVAGAFSGLPGRLAIDALSSLPEGVADDAGIAASPIVDRAAARLEGKGVAIEKRVEFGPVPGWILSHARDKDLVLLGRTGTGGKSRGSVLDPVLARVLVDTIVPMAVVSAPFTGPIERPLLAYDGRAGSHAALSPALELAHAAGLQLTILHLPGYAPKDSLAHVRKHLEGHPASFRWVDAEGSGGAVEQVLGALAAWKHDLLIIGPSGYAEEGSGSAEPAVEALLRRSPAPVLVLR